MSTTLAALTNEIYQVKVGNTNYDIAAKYIHDGTNAYAWSDITNLVNTSFSLEVLTELPTANASTYNTYSKKIVLIASSDGVDGSYDEYVIIRTGTSTYTYSWELIGTTKVELQGLKTSSTTSTVKSVSNSGGGTATGTATISYDKANANTGNAGAATTANSSYATPTITATSTFTGTAATISATYTPAGTISGSVSAHSHTATQTLGTANQQSVLTSVKTWSGGSKAADTFTANTPTAVTLPTFEDKTAAGTATFSFNAVNTWSAGTLPALTVTSTSVVNNAIGTPTVNNGVLSWNAAGTTSVGSASGWSAGSLPALTTVSKTVVDGASTNRITAKSMKTAGSVTAGTAASFTEGAFTAATATFNTASVVKSLPAITIGSDGAVSGSSFVFTGTQATISADYTPVGSVSTSASQASHRHTYIALATHSHSIGTTSTSATGTVEVAVASHTHTIVMNPHQHDTVE